MKELRCIVPWPSGA